MIPRGIDSVPSRVAVSPPKFADEEIVKQEVKPIKNIEMTAFSKTIVGKLVSKGQSLAGNIAKVVSSPNPLQAAAAALSGGVASVNKGTAKEETQSRSVSKSSGQSSTTSSGGNMFTNNKTLIGFTFPLWIWIAIAVVILVLVWWLFKKFISKSPARRRSSFSSRGSSSMRARMARVRAARRKKR